MMDDTEHLQQVQKKLKMSLEDLCRQMPPPEPMGTPKRRGSKPDVAPDPWIAPVVATGDGLPATASSQLPVAPGPK